MQQLAPVWQNIFDARDEKILEGRLLFEQLSAAINDLILHDFNRLVGILYRLDVSEQKIKTMLQDSVHTKSSDHIAKLVIERQLQKIQSRQEHRRDLNDDSGEEKW